MPSNLKNMVRTRMEKTGESCQQALRHVRGRDGSGGSGLVGVIREIIVLAERRLAEYEATHPASVLLSEVPSHHDRPAEKALKANLRRLDLPTLRTIEAVMYAGRENEDVMLTYRHLPKDDQPVTAHMIGSKLPLGEYLTDGLRLVREQGVDLDMPW